jgi:tRNA/rRNA methyltransferase|tara:strand:- start:58615 stop:59310 length:696 start_codon:yes stop_codon:yes gene_type:complete
MGENIGGTARAMLNCGLDRLKLVNPRDGWPNPRAHVMSSGALDIMPEVEVFNDTPTALADYNYIYATTARPRDMLKPVLTPEEAGTDIYKRMAEGQKCAVMFGCERTGLENDDVTLAHSIITVPLNPNFTSLNLSQAVLLIAYECSKHAIKPSVRVDVAEGADDAPAPMADLDNLFSRLENALVDTRFFKEDHRQRATMRNIKNMYTRAELSVQEVKTFHGIITALTKNDS